MARFPLCSGLGAIGGLASDVRGWDAAQEGAGRRGQVRKTCVPSIPQISPKWVEPRGADWRLSRWNVLFALL